MSDQDDTDIEASAAASLRGEHPADALRASAGIDSGFALDESAAFRLNPKQLAAHEALRAAGLELKAAQEQLEQKQLGLRAALDRWLTVNAGEK